MDWLPINVTDLIILVVLLLSALLAFSRGFVHEVLGIGAWIGAVFATLWFFTPVQEIARDMIAIELLADIGAGVAIFLVALILLSVLSRMIGRRVQDSSLGFLDRTLGVVFGLLRGVVIVCLLWLGVSWLMPAEEHPAWLQEARALPLVETGADYIRTLVPAELRIEDAMEQTDSDGEVVDFRIPPLQPTPQAAGNGEATEGSAGYDDMPRREMDRLLDSIREGN
ncbi:CvpA family protein [Aquibaculum sediminis]|uniref:CvpA family protein n=1 Tax=Aquibaculum sediminis TaxID=3231907 RepID=UPI00345592C7